MKLDELANHFGGPKHFSNRQHKIRCGDAFAQSALHVYAHDIGSQKVDRLPEHSRFGLDSTDAPSHDTQSVDHRRVRVGSNKRVRIKDAVLLLDSFCEILEVDLMTYSDSGRYDLETIKSLHTPFQKLIACAIASELHPHVQPQCFGNA